jgi:glycolate oxidase
MFDLLREIVGDDNFSDSGEDLEVYSQDSSFLKEKPLCVLRPKNTGEIQKIVRFAKQEKIPIIPRGAGTNPCGEVVGRAVILDLSRMNRIITINKDDMYAVVEPGVVRDNLNKALKKHNLFFPPDPASSKVATIGGMVSNNSSGLHAIKYGTTKDYVLALEVVLSNGEVIKTGSLALKSSSGYDLNRLFVGSEGTLGIFTKITLHLLPIPRYNRTVVIPIKDFGELGNLQMEILSLCPSAFEFMDELCLKVISTNLGIDFKGKRALIAVEFSGQKLEVEQRLEELKKLIGTDIIDLPEIWNIRKGLVPLLSTYSGKPLLAITEDIGVPVSFIVETIEKVKNIYRASGFEVALYGHLGDGNLHMRVFGEHSPGLLAAADEVYSYVLSLSGTISSEHGVGRIRAKYMREAHGTAVDLMKNVKKTLDPNNILNPGCLFDSESSP